MAFQKKERHVDSREGQIDFPIILLLQVKECVGAFNYLTAASQEDFETAKNVLVDKIATLHNTMCPYWDETYEKALKEISEMQNNGSDEFGFLKKKQTFKFRALMRLMDRWNLLLPGEWTDEEW